MANAKKDENGRATMIGASSADGSTVVQIQIDPSSHRLSIDDNTTGSDNGNNGGNAIEDENGVAVMTAIASDGSGRIIEVYALNGKVLINSM